MKHGIDKNSAVPLYKQLKYEIVRQIECGELKEGQQIPSVRHYMKTFELSSTTVGRAFLELARDGVLTGQIGKGTYVASRTRQEAGQLGFVFSGWSINSMVANPFYTAMYSGVLAESGKRGFDVTFHSVLLDSALTGRYSGMVLTGLLDLTTVMRVRDAGLPCVVLDWALPQGGVDTVIMDSRGGIKAAVEHLLGLGHKDIVMFGDETGPIQQQRVNSYRESMEGAGLAHREFPCGPNANDGHDRARELAESGDMPSAIIAIDDSAAVGAMEAILDAGLTVPGDVSVVGFGDTYAAGPQGISLTTVSLDPYLFGTMGMELLEEQISGKRKESKTVLIPTSLVERQSTAVPGGNSKSQAPNLK